MEYTEPMRQQIPAPVVALVAEFAAEHETHATLDGLFMHAEAPGEPPEGSKHTKALEWLRRTNRDSSVDPLRVLGRIVEEWMETEPKPSFYGPAADTILGFARDSRASWRSTGCSTCGEGRSPRGEHRQAGRFRN